MQVLDEILTELNIGGFVIKLNHRKLLDAIMAIAGVPATKFRPICSAIDKLDKEPWQEVRREMVQDKGLSEEAADKIWTFVELRGAPEEMLVKLQQMADLQQHAGVHTSWARYQACSIKAGCRRSLGIEWPLSCNLLTCFVWAPRPLAYVLASRAVSLVTVGDKL